MLARHIDYYAEADRERLYRALALAIVKPKSVSVSTALIRIADINLNKAAKKPSKPSTAKLGENSRFKDKDVLEMARLRETGLLHKEIAKIMGCSPSSIGRILRTRGKALAEGEGQA